MKLIIFGAGEEGRRALLDIGKENIFCFIDNNKSGEIVGCPIKKLHDVGELDKNDVLFLITAHKYRHEIANELVKEGFSHFCEYIHIKTKIGQALNSVEWGNLYNQTMIDKVVQDVQNDKRTSWSEEILRLTKEGDRVLEIGCGSGASTLHLAKQYRACTAIDYSQSSIDLVKKSAKQLNISVRTQLVDARKVLPFVDDEFDVVFQAGLLEHFSQEERIRLLRLWKPVGKMMVSMIPNANSVAYHAGKILQEKMGDWSYGLELPQASMQGEFLQAGYINVREYTIGLEEAFCFLPKEHYLRVALERWFSDYPGDMLGQGYLICTVGDKEA